MEQEGQNMAILNFFIFSVTNGGKWPKT